MTREDRKWRRIARNRQAIDLELRHEQKARHRTGAVGAGLITGRGSLANGGLFRGSIFVHLGKAANPRHPAPVLHHWVRALNADPNARGCLVEPNLLFASASLRLAVKAMRSSIPVRRACRAAPRVVGLVGVTTRLVGLDQRFAPQVFGAHHLSLSRDAPLFVYHETRLMKSGRAAGLASDNSRHPVVVSYRRAQ